MSGKPLLAVYQNAEQLRSQLIAEIEMTDDVDTLIEYAKAIFWTIAVEEDKLGRIVVRHELSPERKKILEDLDREGD